MKDLTVNSHRLGSCHTSILLHSPNYSLPCPQAQMLMLIAVWLRTQRIMVLQLVL